MEALCGLLVREDIKEWALSLSHVTMEFGTIKLQYAKVYAADREVQLKDDYKEAAFLMAMKLHFLAKEITICLERPSCFVPDGHGIHRYQSAKLVAGLWDDQSTVFI